MRSRRAMVLMQLTGLRIAAIPVVMALVVLAPDSAAARWWALGIFALAASTDYLDGWLARRWDVETTLGSFLDTTADKLLVTGVLVALVEVGRVWSWVVVLIVGRELVVMGIRGLVAQSGAVMPPSIWGKLKALVQFAAIGLAILRPGETLQGLYADEYLMLAAGFVTLMSGLEYLLRFRSLLSLDVEEKGSPPSDRQRGRAGAGPAPGDGAWQQPAQPDEREPEER